jgi:hypothetical protein
MRQFFREGDLLSAEVQQVMSEGGVALHTRSSKYGKLVGGQLLTVPANLVKRQKQHFVDLEAIGEGGNMSGTQDLVPLGKRVKGSVMPRTQPHPSPSPHHP